MIFDSEKQKQTVIDLISRVPLQTTIGGLVEGPDDDLKGLLAAIQRAVVLDPVEVQVAVTFLVDREK